VTYGRKDLPKRFVLRKDFKIGGLTISMNTTTFIIYFKSGGSVTVRAFNQAEARILAQAERIKSAKDYAIDRVETKET